MSFGSVPVGEHRWLAGALVLAVVVDGRPAASKPRTQPAPLEEPAGRRPIFHRVESGIPDILRSEIDFAGSDEAAWRAYIAGRRPVTVEDIRRSLSGATYLTYSAFHGPQIESAGRDGAIALWYPGNRAILHGQWKPRQVFVEYLFEGKLLRRFEYAQVCFRYGANTYNPATGQTGDGWECETFDAYRKHLDETKRGDVLRLSGRNEPPFVLSKDRITLDGLRARVRD